MPRNRSWHGPARRGTRARTLSAPFFFLPRERPLDAPRMHRGREAIGHTAGQLSGLHGWLGVAQVVQKRDDLGGQLVAAPGPALLGQESRQATLLKRALYLIEG